MKSLGHLVIAAAVLLGGGWGAWTVPAHAQDRLSEPRTPVDTVSDAGVGRAAAMVDSVFVDRQLTEGFVDAGDFASYLMARLNIRPIPAGMGLRVEIDSTSIVLHGRVGDLPPEALAALGPLVGMLAPETEYAGVIALAAVAREVVRFRLARVTVGGIEIPEPFVAAAMLDVGKRYPALSRSGRALFVEIPADAVVQLVPGRVRLVGPPADTTSHTKI